MANNPLQQFYRQPKIYIPLPSKGIYNKLGSISGDPTHLSIYSMTGMDEILMKTPDALLAGESTAKLFESCCPGIKDGWEVTSLDTDLLLVAIRIATFGNVLEITHRCPQCGSQNDYDVDLGTVIDHFATCNFENTVETHGLIIKLQPLTYKQSTNFSLVNFKLQQRLAASDSDADDHKSTVSQLFIELGVLQTEIYSASIESIDTGTAVVTESHFIREWIENCDRDIINELRTQFNKNKDIWKIPEVDVVCSGANCKYESKLSIDLDQSSFFAPA
jgi:hypothetical protein